MGTTMLQLLKLKSHALTNFYTIAGNSDRKEIPWIKGALYPKLVPLLRLAYHSQGCDQTQQNQVLKVNVKLC